jgi:hypothetical protein
MPFRIHRQAGAGLSGLHTLFTLEHNHLCDRLAALPRVDR